MCLSDESSVASFAGGFSCRSVFAFAPEDDEAPKKKIEVVSFSAGRVVDSGTVERENLTVTEKRTYIPADAAKAFITNLIQELDKVKKQVQHTLNPKP